MFDSPLSADLARERIKDRRRAAGHSEGAVSSELTGALANASLFALCSKRELKLVAKLAKTRTVRAGTTLITEGEPGDSMFVVLSGTADVRKRNRKIAQLGSGDVVGELAVLAKAPRNATVVARTDCDVAVIGRREVFNLIEEAPGFSRKLFEALANRIRELDQHLVS